MKDISSMNSFELYSDIRSRVRQTNINYSDREKYFIEIVFMVCNELIFQRSSPLLSYYLTFNRFNISEINNKTTHIKIVQLDNLQGVSAPKDVYDVFLILNCAIYLLCHKINQIEATFNNYYCYIFTGYWRYGDVTPTLSQIEKCCLQLDGLIGEFISRNNLHAGIKTSNDIKSEAVECRVGALPDSNTIDNQIINKIGELADERLKNDNDLMERMINLKDAFKLETENLIEKIGDAVRPIRQTLIEYCEGIKLNFLRESVKQMINLYYSFDDLCQSHSNQTDIANSYISLYNGCESISLDILEIMAYLGIKSFGNPGDVYDPSKHKLTQSREVSRGTLIANVLRKGFIYGDQIIEKAIVELK